MLLEMRIPFAFASSTIQLRARDLAMLHLDNIWYVGTWRVSCEAACVYSRYYITTVLHAKTENMGSGVRVKTYIIVTLFANHVQPTRLIER